jgi:mRNA interferase MazF
MLKRFLEWIGIKERLHSKEHKPPLFKEGEVWWCYLGENVGVEMNGKGEKFTRPILMLKKYDKYSFLALPLTTKTKTGSWYVNITFNGINQTVTLSQGRTLDYKRLKEKVGQLEENDFSKISKAYLDLHQPLKNRPPAIAGGSRG